jgi:hypothetical protein
MLTLTPPALFLKLRAASTAAVFFWSLLGMILFLTLARGFALRRLRRAAALRKREGGAGRAAFLAYLEDRRLPIEWSQAAYQYFQDCVPSVKDFPVGLDDSLGDVLGICGPDVDDTILDIAAMFRCRVSEEAEFRRPQTVRDVLDVVVAARDADGPPSHGDHEKVD